MNWRNNRRRNLPGSCAKSLRFTTNSVAPASRIPPKSLVMNMNEGLASR